MKILNTVLLIFLLFGTSPAHADITSNLQGHWTFDAGSGTTAVDSSGNGNTGILSSPAPTWTTGPLGGALNFNGTNNDVAIADSASIDTVASSNQMTISAWIKVSSNNNTYREIVRKDNWFLLLNNTNDIALSTSGAQAEYSNGFPFTADNQWHLITATFDGTTIRMYEDGILQTSYAGAAVSSSNLPLDIGNSSQYGQYFAGSIDDVRVYNRALTLSDVQQLFGMTRISLAADSSIYYQTPYNVQLSVTTNMASVVSVSNIEFYSNNNGTITDLGHANAATTTNTNTSSNSTTNTYIFTWTNAPQGKYALTAVITDSTGAQTTSTPVNIWVTTNDLEGWWKFNEGSGTTASDSSGNNNLGTFSSTPPTWVTGESGGALKFNGNNAVTIASSNSINTAATNAQITMSAWINVSSLNNGWEMIIRKNNWMLLINPNNKISMSTSGSSNEYYVNGFPFAADGLWHLITGTFDGSTINLYEDGILQTSYAAGALVSDSTPVSIGSNLSDSSQAFIGSMDDVRIYARALSQGDIAGLYGKTPVSLATDNISYPSTPATVTLTATTYPALGVNVSNVQFNINNNPLNSSYGCGTSTAVGNIYTLTCNNIPTGIYTLTAQVTDSNAATSTSSPVTIYVNTHVLNYVVNSSGNLQSLTFNGLQFYTSSSNQTQLYTGFYNASGNEVSTGQGFTKSNYFTDASDCNTMLPGVSLPSSNFVCQQNAFGAKGQTGSYAVSRLYSTPDDQTLKIDYYITNNDPIDTMPSFSYEYFMELQTPGIWEGGWFAVGNNGTGSPVTFMSGPWGSMALFTDDYKKNAYFGDVWTIDYPTSPNTTGPANYLWQFSNCSAPSAGADSSDTTCDAIAPNQTWHYAQYIRFGASTDSAATLVPPTINNVPVGNAAFANAFPYLMNWPDRRPIARWFPGGVQCIGPEDPRGWCGPGNQPFSTQNGDISTISSQANFSAYILNETQNAINNMNAQNPRPQSILIWDLEGDEISQSFTYVGNPPQLHNMAPEMDAVADKMFAMFKAAGYQLGMTLRPSNFEAGSSLPTTCNYSSGDLSDVFVLTTPTTPGSTNILLANGPSSYGANVCNGPTTITINASGTKYNGGDVITFTQSGKSTATGWVSGTDSNGGITSIALNGTWDSSSGYPITLTSTGTNRAGTGASITISTSQIWTQPGYRAPGNQTVTNIDGLNLYSVAVHNAGSGYNVGDDLNIVEPGGSRGVVTVTAVNGGAITGLNITNYGQAYSYTSAIGLGLSNITGSGSGATIDLTSNYPSITLANLSSLSNFNYSTLANLEGKVAYAHQRWGARVFYVDSTVYSTGNSFNFKIWNQLLQDFPDCLFMPENQEPYYYGATAPYSSIEGYGETGAPAQATAIWPQAFTFVEAVDDVNLTPGASGSYFTTLESTVEAGNSLFNDTYDNGIDAIYKGAYDAQPSNIPSYTTVGYPLTVTNAGTGSGAVTGTIPINSGATNNQTLNVQEINCTSTTPTMCIGAFDNGTTVTLTAVPASGSIFTGWSGGGCSGTATTCMVAMNASQTVTATFNTGTSSVVYGDVDGSGTVTIVDAEKTAQDAIGLTVPNFNSTAAEVDGTGKVDINDAYLIAEYAVGLITKFPVS